MFSSQNRIRQIFTDLFGSGAAAIQTAARLVDQLSSPTPRPYHNARHVRDVTDRVFAWSLPGTPGRALVAAVLYHDAVYDPCRNDNELLSMVDCFNALTALGVPPAEIRDACDLIWATAFHEPRTGRPDELLLLDADNYILGETLEAYETYRRAVRQEYVHVDDEAWRTGRSAVLRHFLSRPRLYHGNWEGSAAHEDRARVNLTAELAELDRP